MIEMIALLFAYQGVISFEDVGVKGVTNKEEAGQMQELKQFQILDIILKLMEAS